MDSLPDQTGVLKLTEQQNTNFDANRLSAALTMFDPYTSTDTHVQSNLFTPVERDEEGWDPLINAGGDSKQSKSPVVVCPIPQKALPAESGQTTVQGSDSLLLLGDRDSLNSTTSTGSGNTSDGVPFAKSSRSASFDNVSDDKVSM